MSRVERASIGAFFGYLRFALSLAIGIALVPFVLDRVGVRVYGYWLASGELLAYAAMADFGVLAVLPWLIAEADGRRDRTEIRRLMSTACAAAVVVSLVYLAIAMLLWISAPVLFGLGEADRRILDGPLVVIAAATAIVLPLRVAGSALVGLQDVRFHGVLATIGWALDVGITIALLLSGFGLYALALGASVPSLVTSIVAFGRLRRIAPDLLTAWPRPRWPDLSRLYREGLGGWLSAWGWRLTAATDGIVLAAIASPIWITALATTAKLGQMLMQMAWVPGDSGLVGLAQLTGERQGPRTREAVAALLRLYLALSTAAACVVLGFNAAFVSAWVGRDLFGGAAVNATLAGLVIVASAGHAVAVATSVLGGRLPAGAATLASGVVHVVLAVVLGRRFGLIGIPLAAVLSQALVLIPALLPGLAGRSGLGAGRLWSDVALPWARRSIPLLALAAVIGRLSSGLPLLVVVAAGGATGLAALWLLRSLILDFEPVAALVRARLAPFRLDGLVPARVPPGHG
jgi:hypothetical protein